jgi:hypothetical protein
MTYQVGAIEAVLQARLDDKNFDKFDRAVAAAKRSVDSMTAGQMKQAAAMKKAGVATADIAKKLGVSEKAAKDYARSQDKARQSTEKFGKATKTAGGQMKTAVRYAIGLAAAYVGIGQAKAAITTTLEFNKAVQGLNRNLGLTVEQASRWATVAKARDIDTKSLVMSFTALSKKIEEAKGGSESALDVFQSLGVTQQELTSGGQGFQAQLEKVAIALGEAEGGTARQAAAQQLLGRGYQTVLPLFTQGTKSLKEQLKWADEFGTVLSDKTSSGLGDVTEQMRRSKAAMLGLQITFTTATAPAVEALNNEFQKFAKTLNDPNLTDEQKVNRISAQVQRIIDKVFAILEKAAPQIAERAGSLGIAIAKGIATSFVNSGWLGKLAIGVWLIQRMGGWGAIAGMGAKAGGRLGKSLGARFLAVVAPYFAASGGAESLGGVLAAKMGALRGAFGRAGAALGRTMAGRLLMALSLPGLILAAVMLIPEKTRIAALRAGNSIGRSISDGIKEGLQSLVTDLPGGSAIKDAIGGIFDLNGKMSFLGGGKNGGLVSPHGIIGMKSGGRVPGLHPDDTVPAMLEPGEFVMRKKAVDKVGIPFLRTLNNQGEVKGEAEDGKKEIGKTFEELGKDTKRKTEKTERQVVKTFESMRKKTVGSQDRLKRSVKDSWRDIDTDHTKRTADMEKTTGKRFRGMLKTVRARGGDMSDSMGETMSSLQSSVLGGMSNIASQTNKALKAFGIEPVSFGISEKKEKYAGGGFIAGQGKQDTVPLVMGMAAPGEAILSGPQQAEVEQSLAMTRALGLGSYGSLDSLFANVTTPHYAYARGGFLGGVRKFASGGFAELDPAARGLAQQLQGLGFNPTSTYRSDSSTYHGTRDAIDYGDASNNQSKLWSILKPRARQFAELFGPSYLPGPTLMHNGVGFSDSDLQAGHEDHIHVAIVNGLMGGLSPVQIKKQILSGPNGALKSLGQAGLDKMLKAAQKYVNSKQSVMSTGHVSGAGIANAANTVMGRAMMLRAFPASEWPALLELWTRESGWDETATNPTSGAYGIPQSLPPSKMGPVAQGSGPVAAKAQIGWGLGYIKERYGSPAAALGFHDANNWYARGGIIGGKVSRFNDSVTASGISAASNAGLALNLKQGTDSGWNNSKTQGWMTAAREGKPYYADVGIGGKSGIFPIIDLGPAGWVNRAIDVSNKAAQKMGLSVSNFPTDSQGEAWLLGQNRKPRKGSPSYSKKTGRPDPEKVWMPSGGFRPDGKPSGKFISVDRLEQMREAMARKRKALAERKARWDRFRKGQIKQGKSSRGELSLPRFMRPFRPKITGQSGILAAHSPIAGDLGAYNDLYGMLGRIDPRLSELRDQYLGTFDAGTSRSVFKQQEQIRRQRERAERLMRERMENMMDAALNGGPTGGFRPDGKPSIRPKATKKQAQKIRAAFRRAIKQQTAAIRKRHNPASAMKPVTARRNRLEARFNTLSERGSAVSDLLSQAQTNVRATSRVSSAGSRALAGFASGGFVGNPAAMGQSTPVVHITIADPTLSALDPHIEARVNGQLAQVGSVTKQRQRAAGSTGRRAIV